MRLTLVFVRRYQCGASRRMESLVAWVKVTRKKELAVLEVDAHGIEKALSTKRR
jgi:hypothetical protein